MSDYDDDDDDFWVPVSSGAAAEFDELRKQWRDSVAELELPTPGDIVNERYEVMRQIGMGGFGCVLQVRHVDLGRVLALKVLTPHVAQRPGWTERFREEARTTSQIGHENIVFITDFGNCPDFGTYFVMEYLDGESLAEILERGPLSVDEVEVLVASCCAGLDAAHDREIVHCDLKPGNIFRAKSGKRDLWKLLDFGTSSIVMSAVETQTLYGTPKYMSPEHAMGDPVDRRADVFSLGVVAYEAMTGQLPWDTTMWLQATPKWRSEHPPVPVSSIAPLVPKQWDSVIRKALEVEPNDRYSRAGDFADALIRARRPAALQVPHRRMAATPMTPGTVVELNPGAAFRSSLSPGEVFVMSRIEAGLTLGELNRMCAGLPFDIDQTVENMVARGYVRLQGGQPLPDARKPLRPRPTEPTPPPETVEQSEPLDIDELLDNVAIFRERGNFMGAAETLRAAITTWPQIAELHYQHGELLSEYGYNRERVLASLRKAVKLEPDNLTYQSALSRAQRAK